MSYAASPRFRSSDRPNECNNVTIQRITRSLGPNESAAVFSLPFWPLQLNSRIEYQLRSYRESEAILVFRGNVTMLLPF